MDLVDEEDDVLGFDGLLDHTLETLLEVTAILAARHDACDVEHHDMGVTEVGRDPASGYHECDALDERRLAHSRIAQDERVVLAPATEHLHDVADVILATDDGVEFALDGPLGEVDAVLVKVLRRRVVGRELVLLEERHRGEGILVHDLAKALHVDAQPDENLVRLAVRNVHDADEQVLRGDDAGMDLTGIGLRTVEDPQGARREVEPEIAALVSEAVV